MDTKGVPFRDNVHASIMPRRPTIKRRHVFFVLASAKIDACTSPKARHPFLPRLAAPRPRSQGGRGRSPERFRSAKREDQPIRGAAGAPSFLPATRFQGRGRREAGAVPLSDSAARSARTSEGERPRLPDGKTSPYALHLFLSPNDPATTISPSFMMTSMFLGVRSWMFTAGSPFTIRRSAHLPASRDPVSSSQ